ncbi:ACT domain-containing protein ACR3-like [Wolffia australiana]
MEHCWGGRGYYPYFDPDYDSLIERINPASVSVDNETCADTTLVKVDGANKHGILLEMVQVLSDLDLVISKSYVSSDGGWVMDVFHVTDQFGRKISDHSLITYLKQSLISTRLRGEIEPVKTCLGRVVEARDSSPSYNQSGLAILEMTVADRHGVLSEVSAVVAKHGFYVISGQVWTHNSRAACILYLRGENSPAIAVGALEHQLQLVVAASHGSDERWRLRLRPAAHAAGPVHVERRLHQLMHEDQDFELEDEVDEGDKSEKDGMPVRVSVESCEEKGYSVVGIRSRDRPKLLFDTVCTLTDLDYVVFHATVGSHGAQAIQEYFIRRKDGRPLDSEAERRKVARCLLAAVERRVSQGLTLKVRTPDRAGLLSEVTRVFREHGLTMLTAEIGRLGDSAVGTFCVRDASGVMVEPRTMESLRKEIGGEVAIEMDDSSPYRSIIRTCNPSGGAEKAGKRSLGSFLWSRIGRLSSNFGSIKSEI